MSQGATGRAGWVLRRTLPLVLLAATAGYAQGPRGLEWRPIGTAALDLGLAGPAGGPVTRVWYSQDGARLYALTGAGIVFETADFERWIRSRAEVPERRVSTADRPEPSAELRSRLGSPIVYAKGASVYRSEDEGRSWVNVSRFRERSLIGEGLFDLAISPRDDDEIVVGGQAGVWRSLDGGLSWSGLNEGLPNLPVARILEPPEPGVAARIQLFEGEAVWRAGQRTAWIETASEVSGREAASRAAWSAMVGAELVAARSVGDYVYGGGRSGRLWVSPDAGRSWRAFVVPEAGDVVAIFSHPLEPRAALAALAGPGPRLVRTVNGGIFWDDISGNLPPGQARGVAADFETGAVYLALDSGLFFAYTDLVAAGPARPWQAIGAGLPAARVVDVALDRQANQLFVAVEGYGLYATLAPHRFREPRVVNAADGRRAVAAPGTLLSVLGSRVATARAGGREAPVLAASDAESQIQVPFELSEGVLALALTAAASDGTLSRRDYRMDVRAAAPAIFADRDGTPMVLDADRGILLDAMAPARAGGRIQILATGLGRVTPEWPTGLAAPLNDPPRVAVPVRVLLERTPLEVTRATLAPGYVGFYLVEARIPDVVNVGPAELYLEAGGQASGRVTLYLVQ